MRVLVLLAVCLATSVTGVPAARPAAHAAAPQPYDLLIVNGVVVDGTGGASRRADVAIAGGRIAAVGDLADAAAHERLDATGLVVAPGFIDVHTHADRIDRRPLAGNFVQMGVTTIIAGNCGSSALEIGDSLRRIHETGVAVNFGTLIGHNTVRASVMGREDRDALISDLSRMKALVFRGMAEGAIGFSTGLQNVPGIYARASEIIELARVAANEGGIYATHMRNEGTEIEAALGEAIRLAGLLDMPLQISHLKIDSPRRWGGAADVLKLIDAARRRGLKVQADQYAYTAGSSSLSIRFPGWALEGGSEAIVARLQSPEAWARVRREMQAMLEERGFEDLSWATVANYSPDPSLNGLTMAEVAARLAGDRSAEAQLDAARRLMIGGGASMVYHFMRDDDIERIMRDPFVSIAADAGAIEFGAGAPHPRGYGNNARVLGEYVRERGVLTLEEAVRRMTSLPARHFGLEDRGEIRTGAAADVVIFDPARIRDTATYASPHAYPEGIAAVLTNGTVVVRDGSHTGARPGQVLRGR